MVHCDTKGSIKPISWPGQKRQIVTFIDDYSRLAKAYCLKTKDESGDALEKYLITTKNMLQENTKVWCRRSDKVLSLQVISLTML